MTKAQLVEQVADAIGPGVTKRDCALVVDGFLNAVKLALAQGDSIELRGFGSFRVREQKARTARNPRTGEAVRVPARSVPTFKPSKALRERVVNGPAPSSEPASPPRYSDPAFVSFPAPGPVAGTLAGEGPTASERRSARRADPFAGEFGPPSPRDD